MKLSNFKSGRIATALLGLAMVSGTAFAGHIPATPFPGAQPFTVNPGAVGESNASFTASYIDFSYNSEVDQTAVGTFDETGGGFFGTFRTSLGGSPVPATGLGTDYQMYALFSGMGTITPNAAGGLDGVFTPPPDGFQLKVYVDPDMDTAFINPTLGAPDQAVTVNSGGADDVLVGTGGLVVGGFHVFPGLANGDFDAVVDVNSVGGFFTGPFSLTMLGDLTGVNTTITGLSSGGAATDGIITGSGNFAVAAVAAVPEPATLALLGVGLLGLAGVKRTRKS